MLGEDGHLILAWQDRMQGHDAAAMADLELAMLAPDGDFLPDQGEGHRVSIRLEAHQIVVGHDAALHGFKPKRRLPGGPD